MAVLEIEADLNLIVVMTWIQIRVEALSEMAVMAHYQEYQCLAIDLKDPIITISRIRFAIVLYAATVKNMKNTNP